MQATPCQNGYLPDGVKELPVEVRDEMEGLVSALLERGWSLVGTSYDANCFGNWQIDLRNGESTLRLVKDRSQYMVMDQSLTNSRSRGFFGHSIG